MRPAAITEVAGPQIEAATPRQYRSLLRAGMYHLPSATLIFFPQGRVITGPQASRVVSSGRLSQSRPVLAFAYDATYEARERLSASSVELHTLRDFGWSDQRYHEIRTLR